MFFAILSGWLDKLVGGGATDFLRWPLLAEVSSLHIGDLIGAHFRHLKYQIRSNSLRIQSAWNCEGSFLDEFPSRLEGGDA
jgi:hypothetical protein